VVNNLPCGEGRGLKEPDSWKQEKGTVFLVRKESSGQEVEKERGDGEISCRGGGKDFRPA